MESQIKQVKISYQDGAISIADDDLVIKLEGSQAHYQALVSVMSNLAREWLSSAQAVELSEQEAQPVTSPTIRGAARRDAFVTRKIGDGAYGRLQIDRESFLTWLHSDERQKKIKKALKGE